MPHGSEILFTIVEDQGAQQSVQSGSQFERTVLETLAKFGKQLDSLTTKVEGGDSSGLTPSGVSQTPEYSRNWCDPDVKSISLITFIPL